MRKRLDVVEALEYIIKTRQGTELITGKQSGPLMKGQEEFPSDAFTREYSIIVGNGQRAYIKFIYDFRAEDSFANFFIPLKDIILIKNHAKDLDKQITHTRNNGHERFELTNVNKDGAEIKLSKEVK